ncbi:MAG: TonB-dependent receptor [Bacteroides sp.]|nr:TonB-dependent receptor [Bacteroides sp.]
MNIIQRAAMALMAVVTVLLLPGTLHAQAQEIHGTVIEAATGEPLIGASVIVVGSKTGTQTDFDGNFTLSAAPGSTIKVTYIGYQPDQQKVKAGTANYTFALADDKQSLDEVIVVGYGTQKRSEVTGSISTVKGDAIKDRSVNSVADALAGMAAGVAVTKSSGAPGEAPDIIIRGAASVNGMAPLYIVDGVKQGAGFDFNTRDIESIEVLKDAGSCAIYGAEAAGGVILVTTKRGQAGNAQLALSGRFGFRKVKSNVKLLNRDQFIDAKALMGVDILTQEGVEDGSLLPDCDWMDVMYHVGHEQEYMLSLTGGTDKLRYYVSGGWYKEEGIYLDSSADRFSARVNVDYNINKIFSVGTSTYGFVKNENPTRVSVYGNAIPFRTVPTMEPVDEDGNFQTTPNYLNGPNLYGNELTYKYRGKEYGANMLAYINVNILPELTLRVNGAAKFGAYNKRYFSEAFDFRSVKDNAWLESTAGTSQELTYNATLTYDKKFFENKFGLKVMIGSEATKYDAYGNYIRAIDFPVDEAWSVNLSSKTENETRDYPGVGRAMSFFGRVNLSWDNRYYLTANLRRDGSDRFGKNNRWGTFPSVNAMWRIGQEKFVNENLPWLTDAKIRGSYGILGNDGIAQFLYSRAYVGDQVLYAFGGKEVSGWANYKVPNADIKWEEVHQGDFGIDLSFLDNRLNVTYDYYNRQTKDMLYWQVVPLASGINYYPEDAVNTMPINIGKVSNIGHEIVVNWQHRVADLNYSVGFNMSFNQNEVKELGTDGAAPLTSADGINRTENGHAMAMLWGYKAIGIFQSQEQVDEYNAKAQAVGRPYYWREKTSVGDIIFDDKGQGYVNQDCMDFIGNPWPKVTYGLNISGEWRGIDLSLQFQGAGDFQIYNAVRQYTQAWAQGDGNTTMDIYKTSFFGDNGLTDQPRFGVLEDGKWTSDPSNNYNTVSSFWVEDGDYFKLKNLVVGYTLPRNWTRKACIQKARLYFSASNVFTITKYSGVDPEIAGSATISGTGTSMTSRGVDNFNRYLPSRLYSIGLDIQF